MKTLGFPRILTALCAVGLLLSPVGSGRSTAADKQVIPVLRTKTATYTNVTITARSETDLCILHDAGIGNVCFEDLEPESYALVDYVPATPMEERLKTMANEQAAKVMQAFPMQGMPMEGEAGFGGAPSISELDPVFLLVVGIVGLFFHLFFSYCCMLIVRKTGNEPGLMVWLPLFQVFPLLRAAGMSALWFLVMLIPLVNLIAQIMWCFNIVSARGKSAIWAILLILPFTNLIAFLYLAFSSGDEPAESVAPPRLPGLAVRTA